MFKSNNDRLNQPIGIHRILHAMLRVTDLEKAEKFYTQYLGMKLLRKKDYPEGQFTLSFLGFGEELTNTVLELTHNWGNDQYDQGNAFSHIALAVSDIYKTCEQLEKCGVKIPRQPGPMKGAPSEMIAFIQDPDGYQIELIERN
jgi:lactoylglutathione lyase